MAPFVIGEVVNKRTSTSKHFLRSDGSFYAMFKTDRNPFHYADANENLHNIDAKFIDESEFDSQLEGIPVSKVANKKFKEKAAQIIDDKKAGKLPNLNLTDWHILRAAHHSVVPKNIKKGYTVSAAENSLTFIPLNASPSQGQINPNDGSLVEYQDVWPLVDVSLKALSTSLKETITLKAEGARSIFDFEVIGDLADDFTCGPLKLQAPFLVDANGVKRDVLMGLDRSGGKTILRLTADVVGLAYPVEIDPTVTYYVPSTTYDGYVKALDFSTWRPTDTITTTDNNTNLYVSDYCYPDPESSNPVYLAYNSFMAFNTSAIPDAAIVSSATLNLYLSALATQTGATFAIDYMSSLLMSESTLYWNSNGLDRAFTATDYNTWALNAMKAFSLLLTSSRINKTGNTNLRLSLQHTTAPPISQDFSMAFNSSDYTGTTTDPRLDVVYNTVPGAPTVTYPNGGETLTGSHTITWTAATDADLDSLRYQVQISTDNKATWTDIVALTSFGATSYPVNVMSYPDGAQNFIRVRAYDGTAYGAWDESNAAFTIAKAYNPTQPTNLAPASGVSFDRTQIKRFSWQHNDPNVGDVQSKFDLQWSSNGGSTWTTVTQTTANQYWDASGNTFPAGNIVWKVRTYDQGALVGPYSDQATCVAGDVPVAPVFTSPLNGGTINEVYPTFTWTHATQTGYQLQVLSGTGTVLWDTGQLVGTEKSLVSGWAFESGQSYSIKARVKNQYNLWSAWATVSVTCSYTHPALPILNLQEYGSQGYIEVVIVNPEPTGIEPTTTKNDLFRRRSGETTWERIAKDLTVNGLYLDFNVASSQLYEYKARVYGSNSTMVDGQAYAAQTNLEGIWIHSTLDPAGTALNIPYNRDIKTRWTPERQLMKYDGRVRPVAEYGENDGYTYEVTLITDNAEPWLSQLESLIKSKEILCFRDYRGRRIFGTPQDLPETQLPGFGAEVPLVVDELDYTEAV